MTRTKRIAHWAGVVLAAPIPIITGVAFVWWLNGEFPSTVGIDTVSTILALAAGATVLVYLICRAIGWAVGTMLAGEGV